MKSQPFDQKADKFCKFHIVRLRFTFSGNDIPRTYESGNTVESWRQSYHQLRLTFVTKCHLIQELMNKMSGSRKVAFIRNIVLSKHHFPLFTEFSFPKTIKLFTNRSQGVLAFFVLVLSWFSSFVMVCALEQRVLWRDCQFLTKWIQPQLMEFSFLEAHYPSFIFTNAFGETSISILCIFAHCCLVMPQPSIPLRKGQFTSICDATVQHYRDFIITFIVYSY